MSHEKGRKIHITWYVLSEFTSAVLSWMILYFTRRDLLAEPIFIDGDLFLKIASAAAPLYRRLDCFLCY